MAEPRRIALISSALPVAAPVQKAPDPEEISFTSVEFTMVQPSDTIGPTYDFDQLLTEKRKNDKEDGVKKLSPLDEEEEEEAKAVKLAKHFEEKYGSTAPRDMKELGAGYDVNDPFVDDAQSAEAIIPAGWTTQHGGFYISTGPLYIRPLREGEEKDSVYQSATVEECVAATKSMNNLTLKRKRVVESSEEDSEGEVVVRRKKKVPLEQGPSSSRPDAGVPKKSTPGPKTVASMLAAAASRHDPFASSSDGDSVAVVEEAPTDLRKPKKDNGSAESSVTIVKPTAKKAEKADTRSDSGDGTTVALPDEITDYMRGIVEDIKKMAASWDSGKCNFFNPEHNPQINVLLLRLEDESRQFKCGVRSSVFGHVASFLPCTKETLVKRARKLRQDDVDDKFMALVAKMASAIHNDQDGGVDHSTKSLKQSMKKLMVDAVRLKMHIYDIYKQRFVTHEEYVKNFVEIELVPLWKNRAIDPETIQAEALMALQQALRPPSHSAKVNRAKEGQELANFASGDDRNPIRIPAAHSGRTSAQPTSSSSGSRLGPSDLMSVVRSGTKVQHTTKNELRRESHGATSRQPSSSGNSSRRSHSDLNSMGKSAGEMHPLPSAKQHQIAVADLKPIFLPDVNGRAVIKADPSSRSQKKSSDPPPGRGSSKHNELSSSNKQRLSVDSLEQAPSSSSRSGRPSEKPARYRLEIQDGTVVQRPRPPSSGSGGGGSSHHSKKDRHSSASAMAVERPSSNSSAGSGKPAKNSKNAHRNTTDFTGSNFSVESLATPFTSPFTPLPLRAGFSPDNLMYGLSLPNAAAYMYPGDGALGAFMSSLTGGYPANGSGFSRSASGSSPPKITPATPSDSPFSPR